MGKATVGEDVFDGLGVSGGDRLAGAEGVLVGRLEGWRGRRDVWLLGPGVWPWVRLVVDVLALSFASVMALLTASVSGGASVVRLAVAFPVITLAILYTRGDPERRLQRSAMDAAGHVLGVVSLAAVLTIASGSIIGDAHSSPGLELWLWLYGFAFLGLSRAALLSARKHAAQTGALATPTLIVGAGVIGEQLVKRLHEDPTYGLRPVGYLDADPLPRTGRSRAPFVPVLGSADDLAAAVAQSGAGHVILAFSSEPDRVLVETVRECQRLGVGVSLVPRMYEEINERATLDHVGGIPLLALRPTDPRGWQFAIKHAIDRTVALIALLAIAPAMIAIALAVRLSSPGPVLFRQQRVGRDGRLFMMLKFRTMRGDPSVEGEADAGWAAEIQGTPDTTTPAPNLRTTRIGQVLRKSSLDELPQLINVLRGDMSLIGPRPERVGYVRDFERLVHGYADRHRVKSGITGWAQVNGLRGQTSIADRVEWDNHYIQNWSLRMDMRILALTIAEVLHGERRSD